MSRPRPHTNLPPMTTADALRKIGDLRALDRAFTQLGYSAPTIGQPRVKPNGEATVRAVWRDRERGRSICHTTTVTVEALTGDA